MASSIHIISKADLGNHHVVQYDAPKTALERSSVRVRTKVIVLTGNNFSYAHGGTMFHWWDTYPVPSDAPAPYNKREEWGIVPAWGRAEVVESTINDLAVGTLLYGFWPTSNHLVDLKLQPSEPAGHWTEVSKHRDELWTIYNHYRQIPQGSANDDDFSIGCKPVWEAGYLLNSYVFSHRPGSEVHPLGPGETWTKEDADLSAAVVISLSASSKTGRSLAWSLKFNRNSTKNGPLALLQVSANPATLHEGKGYSLPVQSTKYETLTEEATLSWVAQHNPKRLIIFDFGAPAGTVSALNLALSASKDFAQQPSTLFFGVGRQANAQLDMEEESSIEEMPLNTSAVKDGAISHDGADKVFPDIDEAYSRCIRDGGLGDLKVERHEGVGAIHKAWKELGEGKVSPTLFPLIRL